MIVTQHVTGNLQSAFFIIDYQLIHAQFHASKRRTSPISLTCGPLNCYLHQDDDAHLENHAIPAAPCPENVPGAIQALVHTFRSYNRRPQVEYIEACASGLETALHADGFRTESRTVLMACTESTLSIPEPPPGLELAVRGADGSLEDYRQF